MLEDELVACVELDAGLSIDALCVEFGAQSAFRPGSVTAGFSGAADFALRGGVSLEVFFLHITRDSTYGYGSTATRVVDGVGAGALLVRRARLDTTVAGGSSTARTTTIGQEARGGFAGHFPIGP